MTGRVHSIQSFGTVDGPGVRFVTFLSGCPLRCQCCHNPDTWDAAAGTAYTPESLFGRAIRCRDYFGADGGVTLSGGEPLLQADFASAYFALCREAGLHTCLDTSGCVWNGSVSRLLDVTDRVLLDIKYTNEEDHRKYVGCSLASVLSFLGELAARRIPTTVRQVIIPTLNDSEDNIRALAAVARAHSCVDGVELLPFRKLCETKYESMGLSFPLSHIPEPTAARMAQLNALLKEEL